MANVTEGGGSNNDTRKDGGAVETGGLEKLESRFAIWRKINLNPLPAVR